ncbi:hypothetical protein [Lactobacillus sp.]|uniref:hypothetical protein n=1 Tax=Lactobacillus sp. TaxID=1591 RepID=UPI0019C324F1|nr:hypothetical protein [Lactobacillus sp.]MBD5429608.1 hypothetical protein [Lactobacillus sp.]
MEQLNRLGKIITTIFGIFIAVIYCVYAANPLTNGLNSWRISLFIITAVIYLIASLFIWRQTKKIVFLIAILLAILVTIFMIIYVPFFHGYLMIEAIGFFIVYYLSIYLLRFTNFKYKSIISLVLEFLIVIVVICFS